MPPDLFGLSLALALNVTQAVASLPPASSWPELAFISVANAKTELPAFRSAERAVSNWRHDALFNLALSPHSLLQLARGQDPSGISRCVKLNNYWCIKKAGWNGEIASDAEGHVAFASALEGATVAAILLKRYYVDYNRHTAIAIISRWAPAQCGLPLLASHPRIIRVTNAATRAVARADAPFGIQNTLRARWLAAHTRGGHQRRGHVATARRSVVADPLLRMMPAPEIAVGMGERGGKSKPFALTTLGTLSLSNGVDLPPLTLSPPLTSCAADGPRIQAYAAHAAAGVASNANEDLRLFTDDGVATANLARVMSNMAAVEIGPLSVRDWLVEAAIAKAFPQASPEPSPPEAASTVRP